MKKIPLVFSRFPQRISLVYPSMMFISGSFSSSGSIIRSKSEENLNKLNECMENMDDDVSKLFMEYHQTDFRDDPDLLRLLNDYFGISKEVSEICESLRKVLGTVEHEECSLIDKAFCDFEEEKLVYEGLVEGSFRKTFGDLKNFKEYFNKTGNRACLTSDFLIKVQICHEDLAYLIGKLESTMKKIDKKLKRVRGKRAMIIAVLLAPVVAAIAVTKAIAGIFSFVPLEPLATFAIRSWKKSTENIKRERTAITSMERGTMIILKEIEKISRLVSSLEKVEKSMRVKAEFAVKKAYPVPIAMGGMERERKKMKSALVDLEKETARCDGFAEYGRNVARERIVEFLSHGEISSK